MTLHTILLLLHSLLRWLVLLFGLWALYRAWRGWRGQTAWEQADRRAGLFFTIALDTQLLIGIILFVLSPLTRLAFSDFGRALQNEDIRFFVFEHAPLMLVAVLFAHVGNAWAKRDVPAADKHRRAAIWFSLAALVILIAIPWWRPLLPLLG